MARNSLADEVRISEYFLSATQHTYYYYGATTELCVMPIPRANAQLPTHTYSCLRPKVSAETLKFKFWHTGRILPNSALRLEIGRTG
jgi:hypothetical protein